MNKILAIFLTMIIAISACVISVDASSATMTGFINAYKQGDFEKADKIAKKLPKKAKSYNSKMSSGMKNAYLKKILATSNVELYYLADLTGDKKPELFIKKGTCEANYKYYVFKYSKGKTVRIGKFDGGHSYLADYPGEKSILCVFGHMGDEQIYLIQLKNGKSKRIKLNGRDCQYTDYTKVPYKLKSYYCGAYNKYNLSPFAIKNTKAVKTAKKRLNKLVKRINPAIINFYPKTKKLNLTKKNKIILAAISIHEADSNSSNGAAGKTVFKKNYIKKEYKNLFGGKPSFKSLAKKYKKHTKSSMGNEVYRWGKLIAGNISGLYLAPNNSDSTYDFALPTNAKVECIRKIKGGYRIAVAHYMRGYYEWESPADEDVCFAHTLIDVKKNSKSKYKYVIKKINSIVYCKH